MRETFKIAGTKYIDQKEIENLMADNYEYDLSTTELKELYFDGDKIWQYDQTTLSNVSLIDEPDNEYDPKAIRVEVGGIKLGYIKKGSTGRIRNLRNDPEIKFHVELCGGKYKELTEDEDGKMHIEKDATPYYVDLIAVRPDPKPENPIPDAVHTDNVVNAVKAQQNPQQQASPKTQKKRSILSYAIIDILLFIFFWPLGVYGMWKHLKWPKAVKIIITVVLGLMTIIAWTK